MVNREEISFWTTPKAITANGVGDDAKVVTNVTIFLAATNINSVVVGLFAAIGADAASPTCSTRSATKSGPNQTLVVATDAAVRLPESGH